MPTSPSRKTTRITRRSRARTTPIRSPYRTTVPNPVVATSEIQTLALSGNTGTFTLTFNGSTTQNQIDASSAMLERPDIQNALNSLPSIQNPQAEARAVSP